MLESYVQQSDSNKYIYTYTCVCAQSLHHIRFFVPLWTAVCQTPLWDIPGNNNGVSCHFLTQGFNPFLLSMLHWQAILLPLRHLRSHTN